MRYNACMTSKQDYIWTDPERCGGVPCFRGTRIFVSILFDYLAKGKSAEAFLEQYPDLNSKLVYGYLEAHSEELMQTPQRPAA